jgi:two-component sensor histidine kinase
MDQVLDHSTADVKGLLRQQAALAGFASYAFRETDLQAILTEAARVCAEALGVPFCAVCRYRAAENDLLIEAGYGWRPGTIGHVVLPVDESSPQGRAYVAGEPIISPCSYRTARFNLPAFQEDHGIISTVDVPIKSFEGAAYGVLAVASPAARTYGDDDIDFLTGFANVLAEAVATQKQIQGLKTLVDAKNLLLQELNHRVRNNLQSILGMLEGLARTLTDDVGKHRLETITLRLITVTQMHDQLLRNGMDRTTDFGDYLKSLCASLTGLRAEKQHEIDLICIAEHMDLHIDTVTALGMIVAELVSNSYSHGFPDGRTGTIAVSLSRSGSTGKATLTIKDNGVGLAAATDNGYGLKLVRQLMKLANVSSDIQSDGGTMWTLTFMTTDGGASG